MGVAVVVAVVVVVWWWWLWLWLWLCQGAWLGTVRCVHAAREPRGHAV